MTDTPPPERPEHAAELAEHELEAISGGMAPRTIRNTGTLAKPLTPGH